MVPGSRNHATKNLHATLESQKKEKATQSAFLSAHGSSIIASGGLVKVPKDNVPKDAVKFQALINDEVLIDIYNDSFPCTAEQFFNVLMSDDSKFTSEYRSTRKDTDVNLGQWHAAEDEYGSSWVREIMFRSRCHSRPMCPPDTAVTEWQHAVVSADRKILVFETVQQVHDVLFGSYFEIHCRWSLETTSESSCSLDVKVGAHFKKWRVMQSKIKTGVINEYKKEVETMLEVAHSYLLKSMDFGGGEID